MTTPAIETILTEDRRYRRPSFAAGERAAGHLRRGLRGRSGSARAASASRGSSRSRQLYEWKPPYAKWFLGGKTNVTYNCVDRHVEAGLGDKVAYYWRRAGRRPARGHLRGSPARDDEARERAEAMGVRKARRRHLHGDGSRDAGRDARVRAHRRAAHRLRRLLRRLAVDRLQDMECEVLITQDEAWRRGTTVPLKRTADEALAASPSGEERRRLRRTGNDVPMQEGRDHWWHDVATDETSYPCEPMDSRTCSISSTRAARPKPKGIAHTTAGYLVGVASTHHYIFDVKPDSVYWCAADVGWVTGHSYIVYGPLTNGTTGVLYEGARLPRQGPLVGDRRALQGRHPRRRPRSART